MIKEFLEYTSEFLIILSLIFYFSTRMMFECGITTIDIAYALAIAGFLWSRGYAEYLERKLDEQIYNYKKKYKLIDFHS